MIPKIFEPLGLNLISRKRPIVNRSFPLSFFFNSYLLRRVSIYINVLND